MIAPARRAAYEALRAVHSDHADLPHALARSRDALQDERDRALATGIVAGTLRWRGTLDFLISTVARRDLEKLDPEVLDILRLSAYQLVHLDRVPARAVVNDAVQLTRRAGKQSATAFVNALLRRLDRERGQVPLPERPEATPPAQAGADRWRQQALDFLSITLSHPRWLMRRWLERCGLDHAASWAAFNNEPPPMTLRANRLRTTPSALAAALLEHGVETEPARYAPHGLIVTRGNPQHTPLAEQGLFVIQDEASQMVSLLASAAPGEAVLDACASPGGKTTDLAADMENRGLLVATDVRRARLDLLRHTVSRCGATCVRIAGADLGVRLPFRRQFDCVIVDAPCSGLGTLRRDPDLKWRRAEADLAGLAAAQQAMVLEAAGAVRPGGRLIYSTCSSEPEENDEVVAHLLERRPEFAQEDPRVSRAALPVGLTAVLDGRGALRTSPARHGLEAFFGVVLRRY
jgi:16S rRNA (cytosine967-C5)-methyltransferase